MNLRTLASKLLRGLISKQHKKLLTLYNFCSWKQEILDNLKGATIFDFYPYEKREILYSWVSDQEIQGQPIDYLEFGSFEGESIKKWCSINSNSESRFFGFDSFEGLPENYDDAKVKHFGTGGATPQINDTRVKFIKGWFTDTLPDFLRTFKPKNKLIVHMDADLYSSTLFTLTLLNHIIASGTILIFDEFAHIEHEFPAFREYTNICGRKWKLIAAREDLGKVAIKIF